MVLGHLADNFYIVLFAYIAALLPWIALNACDFISPVWRKARDVRVAGYINLALTGVPALYISFYIAIQIGSDTKEVFTAIVALLYALQHLLRTACGLWQLHVFVAWASKSIQALGALGIDYELKVKKHLDAEENKDKRRRGKDKNEGQDETEVLSANEMADELLVSDELIENRLFHENARCYLQFEDMDITTDSSHGDIFLQRIMILARILFIPIRYLYHTVLRRCFGRKSVSKVRQVPYKPEEVWLRWSVAFAAQGLGGWMKEFRVAAKADEDWSGLNNMQQYENQRDYVASRVLATAGLELWPGRCVVLGEDSAVSKTKLVRRVAESGCGLPFDARQVNVMKSAEEGYRPYALKLLGIMQEMPVWFVTEIEGFDIERVEWLAILLNLGREVMSEKEVNLHNLLAEGAEGVERSAVQSMQLYERDIEKDDDVSAMVNLGVLLEEGAEGVERNVVRSMGLYERAIEKGDDVNAMVNLGILLKQGAEGVECNAVLSMELYERAIEKGDIVSAMVNLGVLLEEGAEGVERNAVRSMELYERAIEKGDDVDAMVNLGVLLEEGAERVERNAVRSIQLYERAIEKGDNVIAMVNLGILLAEGAEGVERNAVRSMQMYERAIEKGDDVNAMVNLGVLLEEGAEGVDRDAIRAVALYDRAMAKGNSGNATCYLAMTLRDGAEGVERNAMRAVELFEMDIRERKNSESMVCLGNMMRDGADGVARDTDRATQLYEMAVEEDNNAEAVAQLAALQRDRSDGSTQDEG